MLPHFPINSFRHQFGGNPFKFPRDKVTVITAWSPYFELSVGGLNGDVRLPAGSTLVFGPGEEIKARHSKEFLSWIFGYQYPVSPHVPASELTKVRAEFETKLAGERAKYEAKLDEVKSLLKAASVAALKEASLAVLTSAVETGVVDRLPEKLADAIQSVVEETVKRVMEQAGRNT
jgi:hypothetical protein